MEGTYGIPNKNPHFFVTTEPNRMQIRSYIFIILKHIQVTSHFRKLLMLKVRLSFIFFAGGGGAICTAVTLSPKAVRVVT